MSVLDENGRLFGVVSVIDLIAILLAISVVVAGVVVFLPSLFSSPPTEERAVRFQVNNVPQYIANGITEGPVPNNENIITVINKSKITNTSKNSSTVDLTIWMDVQTTIRDGNIYLNNNRIYLGKQVTIDLGNVIVKATVTKITNTQ